MDASQEVVALDPEVGPQEQLQALRQLLKSPGWELLAKHAEMQISTRTDHVMLVPLESTSKLPAQEFMKGEAAGIRLFIAFPETLIEIAKAVIDERKRNEQDEPIVSETSGDGTRSAP